MNTHEAAMPTLLAQDDRLGPLRRMKCWALALLLTAITGLGLATLMGGHGIWAWIKAFCEAAAVGAVADWFAVVALFRRPLGLPIPHTAIIPSNKNRIADNLAFFVRDHFLEPSILLDKLSVFDPAARLAHWLTDPARVHNFVGTARKMGLQAVDFLDDTTLQQAFKALVLDALHRWNAAHSAGQVLNLLTRDGRHDDLLNLALEKLGHLTKHDKTKAKVSDLIARYIEQEYPKISWAVNLANQVNTIDSISTYLADKISLAMTQEFGDILQNPSHPLRIAYGDGVNNFIHKLRVDPDLEQRVQEIKSKIIDHPSVHTYIDGLVTEVKDWLRRDLTRDDSRIAQHIQTALMRIGTKLSADPELRESINSHVLSAAGELVGDLRVGVTEHIAQTIKDWDETKMVREMEVNVGKDLQYIRVSGTLVGGTAGLVLHIMSYVLTSLLPHIH
jgi:uncharacterized membrane-anchored protein YjiN (DUF445 family)